MFHSRHGTVVRHMACQLRSRGQRIVARAGLGFIQPASSADATLSQGCSERLSFSQRVWYLYLRSDASEVVEKMVLEFSVRPIRGAQHQLVAEDVESEGFVFHL